MTGRFNLYLYRRLSMMKLSAASFFVCGLGAGLATSIWMFIVFHFIGGIGIGFSSVAAPAYIAEISPPRFRGRLGSLQQLAEDQRRAGGLP